MDYKAVRWFNCFELNSLGPNYGEVPANERL